MGSIFYTQGTVYNPASSTSYAPSAEVDASLSDTYSFYFNPLLEDIGYAPFATYLNETRGVADARLELNATDYAYFFDFGSNTGPLTLNGGENDDVFFGGRVADHLLGDDENDQIIGGTGADLMEGGDGNDAFYVDNAGDLILEAEGLGTDTIYTSVAYSLTAGQEIEFLRANVTGSTGLRLTGNELDQSIVGSAGRDTIAGAEGRDTLTGGASADLFVYSKLADSTVATWGRDMILDFSHAQGDRLDLRAIDANTKLAGNQAFTFIGNSGFHHRPGELESKVSGANTIVSGDVDGNGSADFSVLLKGHHFLEKGDFLL